ncbi:LacI family DNA-binding transcriptional regulator [Cellulomonas carbonis]|uniref:Transcriptional regulator n=1 Tax=Cellulomonas carbonis T26 TaxID=947969 RepID=A0A0A0BXP1_9CELL|nr:LacI family DNA-binding transcriptional regulator [Cellulomonas carbonis]KGM12671.1 transcriptional regulator [Cellulomonas carbonis T26]GGC06468.1 LacI family transcriptional regulator [Cellulomonas carbonis]
MADDKAPRAANIFDVARLAGVSHQTVSRVLNDLPNVRPATRERVEHAIAQLRYSPSPAARSLVSRRTRTLGLIAPAVSDHGPTRIGMSFSIAAHAARYSVDTVAVVDDDPGGVRAAIEGLLRRRVDGIAMIVMDIGVLEMVRELDLSVPVVAAASSSRRSPLLVQIDQYRGARAAVRHLAELGHTRIAHIAGPARAADAVERVRGWRDELAERGLPVVDLAYGDWTAEAGYRLGREMDLEPGMAVFASNDLTALGLLSALRERSLGVPEDISVVGFDDIPEAAFLYPPLTTVRQDFSALGALMVQKLLVTLEEDQEETTDTPLPTRLVVRESTRSAVRDALEPSASERVQPL